MVDARRVAVLLDRIRAEVSALRRSGARPTDELFDDPDALPALKYRLVVAIEAATDVADHLIASEGFRLAAGYADSFRSLEEAGVLPSYLAASLADAARFRNLLVHRYADIDDGRVIEIVRNRLTELEAFVDLIAQRLAGPAHPPA
jgi:uncharacterized protein YutE (UPF0331/DUF86 family)